MSDPTMVDVKIPGTDWMKDYDTGQAFVPPPQAKEGTSTGRNKFIPYQVQVPAGDKISLRDEKGEWLKTREGFLKAVIDGCKLVDSGYELRETHIGTAQYRKYVNGQPTNEFRHASPSMDYFRAFGMQVEPSSAEDYETFFKMTGDRMATVCIEWTAYDNDSKTDVARKWEDFPLVDLTNAEQVKTFNNLYPGQDPAGKRIPYIEKNSKRFWARAEVKRWVSAVED